jgi:isopenicillin-N epimerase
VKLYTSDDPAQACAIGLVGIEGIDASPLVTHLWEKHRIWATGIVSEGEYQGIRITPNVYTTLEEIDTFADVMEKIARRGSLV